MITFLSIAGVTVGVMALVVVIAVMSGAQTDFRKRILGLEPHMHLMSQGGKFKNYEQIQKKCMEIEGVKAASPIIFSQAAIRTSYSFAAVFVRGIDPNSKFSPIQGYTPRQLTELLSETRPKGNLPGIILGKQLANNVGALPGDKILLLSPKSLISPTGSIPSMKRFVVKGTFESGMDDYDRVLAFVNLTQGQKIDKSKNRVDAIGL
ncbi:MAG: ABC transporter permease, partial [Desulfobacteraceae bacterium]|nr:ABC transporter permease [Desulfobacteraceae bacterium]